MIRAEEGDWVNDFASNDNEDKKSKFNNDKKIGWMTFPKPGTYTVRLIGGKDIPDEKGLYEFCKKNFVGWLLKQGMIYKLQNIDKLPFYRSFKKNHEITSKPFATKQ